MADAQVTSSVEVPPNKAIAAVGGTTLAGAALSVLLWAIGVQPPAEIVVEMTTLANALAAGVATYWTPHGAVVKETTTAG